MQDLYIELENGLPINHPITGDNLRMLNPDIDLENLSSNLAKFQRNPGPRHGVYEKIENEALYEFIDGVVHDVWVVTKMTKAEIKKKQSDEKALWASMENSYASWVFNPAVCHYEPPVPYPTDGKHYIWDESAVAWVIFDPGVHLNNEQVVDEIIPDETAIDETVDPTVPVTDTTEPAVLDDPAIDETVDPTAE